MSEYEFGKVCGAGNDFIVFDNRNKNIDIKAEDVVKICSRTRGVGGDGVMLVENSDEFDFYMRIFNADGSEAEMCGNGARCIAWYAYKNEIAPAEMKFDTIAGVIEASVIGEEDVKLKMSKPFDLKSSYTVNVDGEEIKVGSINTGVPHVVVMTDDVTKADVFTLGRKLRYHEDFAPAGTNANFISLSGKDALKVRTYERGVEGETLACGTGSVASAMIAYLSGVCGNDVSLETKEADILKVSFDYADGEFDNVYLSGPAVIVYTGKIKI